MPLILVIDDNRAMREITAQFLADAGYDVDTAESGRAGLARWGDRRADLVIVDLQMADLDGVSVLKEMRALAPNLPAIVVSGNPGAAHLSVSQAPGLQASVKILGKPFRGAELVAAVRTALSQT